MFDGGDERGEAARVGLSVDEYREWRELNGTPLCGHVLRRGVPTGRRACTAIPARVASSASFRAMSIASPVTGASSQRPRSMSYVIG